MKKRILFRAGEWFIGIVGCIFVWIAVGEHPWLSYQSICTLIGILLICTAVRIGCAADNEMVKR